MKITLFGPPVPPRVIRCLALVATALLALLTIQPLQAVPAGSRTRVTFANSVRPVATTVQAGHANISRMALRADETSAPITVEVALKMRHLGDLQARIGQGELISDAEMDSTYFPTEEDHARVLAWVQSQGLSVTRTDRNRLAIFAKGSVAQVAQAFEVTFARVARDGREYTSAVSTPSLPSDISAAIVGIHGLQPHLKKKVLTTPQSILHPDAGAGFTGYNAGQISSAYNAAGLTLTGAGQTVAVYALGYPQTSDLNSFWKSQNVAQTSANVVQVNVAGGPATNSVSDYVEEATLDVEWIGALAPAATIRIYAANENDQAENDEILQQIAADAPSQPTMHILSISVGGNELEVDSDYLEIEAQYMANLARLGLTILSADGDDGSKPDGVLQTTYPTSDPSVTGVGGTTLNLNGVGAVTSESAWNSTGGGISAVFSRPSWQAGTSLPTGSMRLVPDVAADGDPNTGVTVTYNGKSEVVAGTSLSAPIWAGFCALINQSRQAAGQTALGFLNPRLYPLLGTSALRQITTGSNGTYSAAAGYNLLSGVGVPNVAALLTATLPVNSSVNISSQLANSVVTVGQPATFFINATGALPLTYQWQRKAAGSSTWASLTDSTTYSGSTTTQLIVTGTTAAMTGDQFQCIVSNSSSTATSAPAMTLTVNTTGVTTLAGFPGSAGTTNGTGRAARFNFVGAVRVDAQDNVYVADPANSLIRKVTPAGVVTTVAGLAGIAGSIDGSTSVATFNNSGGVAVDSTGNVYVADSGNYTIRKISSSGTVSTLAGSAGNSSHLDGTGPAARFTDPENLCVDSTGNIFVADGKGYCIRKVTPAGVVTTVAGGLQGQADGTVTAAQFGLLTGIAVDATGNLYVCDNTYSTIRKVSVTGQVTTIGGVPTLTGNVDGPAVASTFNAPGGLCVYKSGNVFVADSFDDTIREITPAGVVTTVAGSPEDDGATDGPLAVALFSTPSDITVDANGVLFVADGTNYTVRRIVVSAVAPPVITTQPQNQVALPGAPATFSVVATGTGPLFYQWYFNNQGIQGANSATFTLASAGNAYVGNYSVAVYNDGGAVVSNVATFMLGVTNPTITTQPTGLTVAAGASFTLNVVASGNSLTYQWYINGTSLPGATSSSLTISNAQAANAGSYTVLVSNSAGAVSSGSAPVTVTAVASSGGGGGGGAVSGWFYVGVSVLALARYGQRRRRARA